jgi:YggT family protein
MSILVDIIRALFTLYLVALIASVLLTYVPDFGRTQVGLALQRLTAPYFAPFRRVTKTFSVGRFRFDLSTMIGILAFFFIQAAISNELSSLMASVMTRV